ncbi:Golgin sub A member 2 [Schistosoma haematobium]|uniref:Golgin sub A member 2 n=1 Tax=Schistosoma haematobium TaxID=6185 RepID=A0A922LTX9_SCHHA|nr:Golgin sub A member 2 [Schistosoma haematobium]KAH9593820.1 Golgin sub A member 2 [Schistosoma haematobium]
MSELSRAEKIAAAKKKLREFQASKANKQSNESYVNQTHGSSVPGTGGYRTNILSQQEDNHCILPVDNCQSIQLEQKQKYQHGFNLSNVNINENYANASIYQPQSPSSVTVPQNNDNAVISLADYFNNSTHYYHPPPLQSLPNNNTNDNHSVSYSENGQCVLHDLTVHSNLTDKHQFVVSSPTSLSSAFEIPNRNANQTVPMTDNTEYLSYPMYNNNNNDNNSNIPVNIEFGKQQSESNSNDSTVFPTSYYHLSSESAAIHNVNNSNQENNTLVQLSYPQYDGDEEEKEVVNDIPTAATEKLLQLTRQLDGILETSERLTSSMHTSGTTSPIMNEFTSNHGLLESFHYPESCRQYSNQTGESHDQLTKDYSHCSPNSLLSGESSQMSISQNHLVRELEERNVELASMLEKRNRAYERLTVKMDLMKDQYERRLTDLSNERTNLQNISQRDLEKTKEQIKAHAKTIGILVAEKTELQSQVTHLDNLAVQRLREIEEVSSRLKASRQQILDLERNLSASKANVNNLQTGNNDLQNQVSVSFLLFLFPPSN